MSKKSASKDGQKIATAAKSVTPNNGITKEMATKFHEPKFKRLIFRRSPGYDFYYANTVFGGFFYTIQCNIGMKPSTRSAQNALKDYTWWCNDFLSDPKNQGTDTLDEAMEACNRDLKQKIMSLMQ